MEEPTITTPPSLYNYLRRQQFSDAEIEEHLRPKLAGAGFADQEINEYFSRHKLPEELNESMVRGYFEPDPPAGAEADLPPVDFAREGRIVPEMPAVMRPENQTFLESGDKSVREIPMDTLRRYGLFAGEEASYGDVIAHGLESSVSGLASRGKMADSLTQHEVESLPFVKRQILGLSTVAGDMPSYLAGAVMGGAASGGNPVGAMAGAFALNGYLRAKYMDQIQNGTPHSFFEGLQREGIYLYEGAKEGAVGALTGAAGGAATGMIARAGGGLFAKTVGSALAEAGTLTAGSSAMHVEIPHYQDFLDNLYLISMMKGMAASGALGQRAVSRANQDVTPKLRETYAATGMMPREVMRDVKADPTVLPDLLSKNKAVPDRYVLNEKQRVVNGEQLPVSELEPFKNTAWGQAAIAEKESPAYMAGKLSNMFEQVVQGDLSAPREYWGIVRTEEAARLNAETGFDLQPGLVHVVGVDNVRHAIKNHGSPETEAPRGQVPITAEDLAMVPEIIRSPDTRISPSKTAEGLDAIEYRKDIGEEIVVIEEIRTKQNQLAFKTMWKIKNSSDSGTGIKNGTASSAVDPTRKATKAKSPAADATDKAALETSSKEALPNRNDTLAANKVNTSIASNLDLPYLERGQAGDGGPVRLSDIVRKLGEALDVPIRTGGISLRNAAGVYKTGLEVIRTRVANDVSTVMHEAGHHLQKMIFGEVSETPLKPFADELAPIATKPREGQSNLPEGFAEFVARYVIEPEAAKTVAPRFFEHFEALLGERAPEAFQAFKDAQAGIKLYVEQPAMAEVISHINSNDARGGVLRGVANLFKRETWADIKSKGMQMFIDDLQPLKEAVRELADGEALPADKDPYILARLYKGVSGKGTHFLEYSPFKFESLENVGKPLKQIVREAQAAGSLEEFKGYLVAKRAIELEGRGVRSGLRIKTAETVVEQYGPKYEAMARDLMEYQDHMVDYLVDSGVLSKDGAAAMREANKNYVPFFRVMEEQSGKGGSGKSFTAKNPVKRIKGSGRDIIDPLESIVKNTYAFIDMAERNAIGRALVELAEGKEGAGWLVEKLPTPLRAQKISAETILQAVRETSPEAYGALKEAIGENKDLSASLFSRSNFIDKNNQITVMRDGKAEVYQVNPEVAEVMNGLGVEQTNLLLKLLAIPTKTLRAGCTLIPEFMIRNLIRDNVHAGVQTRGGYVPFKDAMSGIYHAWRKTPEYRRWQKSGGPQAALVSMDRSMLQRTLGDLEASGVVDKTWNIVKHPVELLRIFSELSEEATRVGEFMKSEQRLGQGRAELFQAGLNSRDVSLDFARAGTITRAVNMLVPFTNATVQGLARIAENFKENPAQATARALMYITAPSALLAWANYGDERIKEVPQWQKDIFWLVPVGQGEDTVIWRIPKPFELGVVFGSIPERFINSMLDMHYGGDADKAMRDFANGLGGTMWDVATPGIIPTVMMPFMENWANKSTFFDRPVIPADREGMLPEYQYAPYTTELTKAISGMVGDLSLFGREATFAPSKLENIIRGWTGGLGMQLLQVTDLALRKAGVLPDPEQPTPTLADIPIVRALAVRQPSMSMESLEKFRRNYDEAQMYLKTITGLEKEMRYEDMAAYLPYSVYEALNGSHSAIQDISGVIRNIYINPDISGDEKRQLIDSLTWQAVEIAKFGNEAFDAVKEDLQRLADER